MKINNALLASKLRMICLLAAAAACIPSAMAAYVTSKALASSTNSGICTNGLICVSNSDDSRTSGTTHTLSISTAVLNGPDSRNTGSIHASSVASVDLSTGALRARAQTSTNIISYDPIRDKYDTTSGSAGASASFEDVLSFHVDSFLPRTANTYQIGSQYYKGITIGMNVVGSAQPTNPDLNTFNAAISRNLQAQLSYSTTSSLSADPSAFSVFQSSNFSSFVFYGIRGARAFSSQYSTGPVAFQGVTIMVLAGDFDVTIDGSLAVSASGYDIDYSHTALLSISQTPGVTLTGSQSGVFLSKTYDPAAPIPEPESWVLMLGGLALLGCIGHQRVHSRQRLSA